MRTKKRFFWNSVIINAIYISFCECFGTIFERLHTKVLIYDLFGICHLPPFSICRHSVSLKIDSIVWSQTSIWQITHKCSVLFCIPKLGGIGCRCCCCCCVVCQSLFVTQIKLRQCPLWLHT